MARKLRVILRNSQERIYEADATTEDHHWLRIFLGDQEIATFNKTDILFYWEYAAESDCSP